MSNETDLTDKQLKFLSKFTNLSYYFAYWNHPYGLEVVTEKAVNKGWKHFVYSVTEVVEGKAKRWQVRIDSEYNDGLYDPWNFINTEGKVLGSGPTQMSALVNALMEGETD